MATKVTKIRIETKKSFQKHNENNSNQKAVSNISRATKKNTHLRNRKVFNPTTILLTNEEFKALP